MSLYPQLEQKLESSPQAFRLNKITEIQKQLEKEAEQRRALYKKYKKAINIVDGHGIALNALSLGAGIAGIGLLAATSVMAPFLIPLEIVAVGFCVFSTLGNVVNRRLSIKCKKHYEISVIAETKLNTISSHVSKALQDNDVSDEEFNLILNELEKYNQLKAEVRSHASKSHDSFSVDQKKILDEGIKKGRAQILDQIKGAASDVK